jgi:hypothetical protein
MSKRKCKCGHIIDLTSIPSENRYYLSSELVHNEFCNSIKHIDFSASYQSFTDNSIYVDKCPKCKRLYLSYQNSDVEEIYNIED